jgi:hypothetical protein
MSYVDFNKSVLEFYTERANSSFCNLAIDDNDVKNIIGDLPFFTELQQDWNLLLESLDDIPQYLGLIAIQCLAASQREADKENDIGENEYQIRLKKLLDLKSDSKLQDLYKGINSQNPIQEQIWFAAKDFLQKRYCLEINIPPSNTHAGRYVQYPKSQSLLTKEELKRFTPFFSETFVINESISLQYFAEQCKNNLRNIPLRQRAKILFIEKEKQCCEQVFNYFNHWDGTIFSSNVINNQSNNRQTQYTETSRLFLSFDENKPKVHWNSKEITWEDIFNIKDYKYFQKDLFLFTEHEYYKNEYEDARILAENSMGYIALNNIQKPNEYSFLIQNNIEKHDLGNSIFLFKINSNNIDIGANFKANTVKLIGGIRLNRKREYLEGSVPFIACDEEFVVIFEHKKITYNSEIAQAGSYKVRVNGYKDFIFEIIAPQKTALKSSQNKGWLLESLTFQNKDINLEGSLISLKNVKSTKPIIRKWIDTNLKNTNHINRKFLLTIIPISQHENFKN